LCFEPHTNLKTFSDCLSSPPHRRGVGVCPGDRKVARLTFCAVCSVRNSFTGLVPSCIDSGRSLADGFLWPIGTPSSGSGTLNNANSFCAACGDRVCGGSLKYFLAYLCTSYSSFWTSRCISRVSLCHCKFQPADHHPLELSMLLVKDTLSWLFLF